MALTLLSILVGIGLTGWVARDAARRGRSWYAWSWATALTGIFGVIAWLAVRRRAPVTTERLGAKRSALLTMAGIPCVLFSTMSIVFISAFLFQFARISGLSMAPTLRDQERVIVNKLAYRLGTPHRGNVVMHYYPRNPDLPFVTRIIAEERDSLRIVDGKVFVNDGPAQDDFVSPEYRSHDDFGPTVVPEGHYFVMGDHRNGSADSRHWGFVPKRYVLGRIVRLWR